MHNYIRFYFQSHHIYAIALKTSHHNGAKHILVCSNTLSLAPW